VLFNSRTKKEMIAITKKPNYFLHQKLDDLSVAFVDQPAGGDKRILMLSGDVEVMTVDNLIRQIVEINDYDDEMEEMYKDYEREPIRLYINSYGGGAHEVLGLINVIKSSRTPVVTICTGYAMSAGALLLACGDLRIAYPYSTIMFHEMNLELSYGTFPTIKNDVSFYDKLNEKINQIWVDHTKMTLEELQAKINGKNWYMDAQEALEKGIIDYIVEFCDIRSVVESHLNQGGEGVEG
jgi:ATP-dependent Clp protease protease subunit